MSNDPGKLVFAIVLLLTICSVFGALVITVSQPSYKKAAVASSVCGALLVLVGGVFVAVPIAESDAYTLATPVDVLMQIEAFVAGAQNFSTDQILTGAGIALILGTLLLCGGGVFLACSLFLAGVYAINRPL